MRSISNVSFVWSSALVLPQFLDVDYRGYLVCPYPACELGFGEKICLRDHVRLDHFVGNDLHDGQQQISRNFSSIVHTPEATHAFVLDGSIIMFIFSMSKEHPLVR